MWQPWTVAVAFLAGLGLALAGRASVAGDARPLLAIAVALTLLSAAPVALALALANRQRRPTAADFGLRRPPLRRAIGLSIGIWIALTAATVLWLAVLGVDDRSQTLTERLGTDGALRVIVLIVVLTVLAPLGEEFLFRGYIFRALRNRRGVVPAALITGLLFAAAHIGWSPVAFLVPVAAFGCAMCLLYHWTESLYPCIALHAINNAIPLGGPLGWTWQIPLLIAGSAIVAVAIAWWIGRCLAVSTPEPE